MRSKTSENDFTSLTQFLVELADCGVADESEYGVHRFGRRVVVEHELGDVQERWPTVEEARQAFELARADACFWQTGHPYDCQCAECEPDAQQRFG